MFLTFTIVANYFRCIQKLCTNEISYSKILKTFSYNLWCPFKLLLVWANIQELTFLKWGPWGFSIEYHSFIYSLIKTTLSFVYPRSLTLELITTVFLNHFILYNWSWRVWLQQTKLSDLYCFTFSLNS